MIISHSSASVGPDYLVLVSALELLLADDECMSAFSFRPTICC